MKQGIEALKLGVILLIIAFLLPFLSQLSTTIGGEWMELIAYVLFALFYFVSFPLGFIGVIMICYSLICIIRAYLAGKYL